MLLLLEYFITGTGNRTKTINRTGLLIPPLNGFLHILRPYNKDFFLHHYTLDILNTGHF